MKKLLLFTCLLLTVFSCKKDSVPIKTNATIENTGYACGLACDAITFSLKVNGNEYWPSNLSESFRVAGLPVSVSFRKTGKHPKQFEGPDLEIVEIISIQKR